MSKFFGGLKALSNIDLTIEEREIVGLIGANGAGKTTFFNVVSGFFRNSYGGSVEFKGRDLKKLRPNSICKLGIARTFQVVRPFRAFTVHDNVAVGAVFGRKAVRNIGEARNRVLELLEFSGLCDHHRSD